MPDIFDVVAEQQSQPPPKDIFDFVAEDTARKEQDLFDRIEALLSPEEEYPEYVPGPEEPSITGYYRWLHHPTKPAESVRDWMGRVVPESISKTAVGVAEFPYHLVKSFTDPWVGMAGELYRGEKEVLPALGEAGVETGQAALQNLLGLGEFFGKPIGLYGWEEMKKTWLAEPAAGALAVMPWVKAARMPRGPTVPADVSTFGQKAKGLRGVPRRVYEWADVRAPFERVGADKTATAVQGFPTVRIIENKHALEATKQIRKLKIPVEEGEILTKRVANSIPADAVRPEINTAAELLRKDYKDAFLRLQKDKGLRSEWPYSWLERNNKRIAELEIQIPMLKNELKAEWRKARTGRVRREEILREPTREFERKTFTEEGLTVEELPKMAQAWKQRIKEALENRGFSPGEVSIALEFVKDRVDVSASIGKIIKETTTETIKQERIVNTIIERVMPNVQKLAGIRRKINSATVEIQDLKTINEQIKTMKPSYEHIPLDRWFQKIREAWGDTEGLAIINRQFSSRLYRGRFFRMRHTIDIGEVIDWLKELKDPQGKPIFEPLDFDARIIRAFYAQKAGTVRGLAKIFENAKHDQLLISNKIARPDAYGSAPPEWVLKFPELKNYWIHQSFMNWLDNYVGKVGPSMGLGRIMGYTKMMAFHNPIFLPGYDLWQMSWALGPLEIYKMPKYVYKGFKSNIAKDAAYWEASENIAFSTPYAPPWENFIRDVQRTTEHRLAVRAGNRIKQYWKGYPILDDFYRGVWNSAWFGDQSIRMGTFHYFKDKGYTPEFAGEMTRTLHADYARLSPQARTILNKIMFTPTFKYTMGHVQANMVKSSVNIMRNALTLKSPSARDVVFAKGALSLVGGMMAKNYLMKRWGFKTDAFGLRYTKEIETEEGLKELVIYWPDPNNVILRQVLKWSNWQDDPKKIDSFINKAHWDLHPLWATATEILFNQKPGGEVVYDPFDAPSDPQKIALDIAKFASNRIVGIFGFIEKRVVDQGPMAAHNALQKDIGKIWSTILEPVTLNYLRKPKFARDIYRIKKLQNLYKWYTTTKNPPKTNEEAQRRINNFFERLQEITEDWETEKRDIFDEVAEGAM